MISGPRGAEGAGVRRQGRGRSGQPAAGLASDGPTGEPRNEVQVRPHRLHGADGVHEERRHAPPAEGLGPRTHGHRHRLEPGRHLERSGRLHRRQGRQEVREVRHRGAAEDVHRGRLRRLRLPRHRHADQHLPVLAQVYADGHGGLQLRRPRRPGRPRALLGKRWRGVGDGGAWWLVHVMRCGSVDEQVLPVSAKAK